jgi:hypothetical protein
MQMACYQLFDIDTTQFDTSGEDMADAILIAQLLSCELEMRVGRAGDIPIRVRVALQKKMKVLAPVIEQPFTQRSDCAVATPTYGDLGL